MFYNYLGLKSTHIPKENRAWWRVGLLGLSFANAFGNISSWGRTLKKQNVNYLVTL